MDVIGCARTRCLEIMSVIENPDKGLFPLEQPPPLDVESFKQEILHRMIREVGRDPSFCSKQDWFYALALVLRERLSMERVNNWRRNFTRQAKWVYYLSMELLPGRMLRAFLDAQGLLNVASEALHELGVDLDELWAFEAEPALGTGGLGRLAACILESMATFNYAGQGYSIRYQFGMFRQKIENGQQVEQPDNWLQSASPWEFDRPYASYRVQFRGRVAMMHDERGDAWHWLETEDVIATARDLPVMGLAAKSVSAVRLWSARATQEFDLNYFNKGDYIDAMEEKSATETLSSVLYPSDATFMGRELRLKQEYFLVSASLQDIFARHAMTYREFEDLPNRIAIQLNDTHPVLAIPEMMRLLVDVHRLDWDRAWDITVRIFSFTNHTLLSEALETWTVELMERLLPRHLQIIYEINARLLRAVGHQNPGDIDLIRRMSMIDENAPRSVRMAHLAIAGSHKVNGVSKLHTELMRRTLFRDFDGFFPGRIIPVTNGVSPRVWLLEANPPLAQLITSRISSGWLRDLDQLKELVPFIEDQEFRNSFSAIKKANKRRLTGLIRQRLGIEVDADSLFDLQVKRIHEYKRQLLNLLHVIARYNRIRVGSADALPPRTVIFSGKAAPNYLMAKRIIHLIHRVADVVNHDPAIGTLLKVVFVPNYDVGTAQDLIPAADLSQQISTVGTEASGTGNMKLALNGALTIGTHDGANDEIAEAVGPSNVFMFGREYDQTEQFRHDYESAALYESNAELKHALDMIAGGYFSAGDKALFAPIFDSLVRNGDHFLVLADFAAYLECQAAVDSAFVDQDQWIRKSICNTANVGRFSIDRAVREYAQTVWDVQPTVT
jgi:glycogen phosphorylase